ncbi:MAG: hypothetical protein JSV51_06965 [Candidatus Bathyarchaeota archaeon]|nr:MAG: hypothetical protein JSV51_06965 [Candidatus Bathyarchaeota archaeon]
MELLYCPSVHVGQMPPLIRLPKRAANKFTGMAMKNSFARRVVYASMTNVLNSTPPWIIGGVNNIIAQIIAPATRDAYAKNKLPFRFLMKILNIRLIINTIIV